MCSYNNVILHGCRFPGQIPIAFGFLIPELESGILEQEIVHLCSHIGSLKDWPPIKAPDTPVTLVICRD